MASATRTVFSFLDVIASRPLLVVVSQTNKALTRSADDDGDEVCSYEKPLSRTEEGFAVNAPRSGGVSFFTLGYAFKCSFKNATVRSQASFAFCGEYTSGRVSFMNACSAS